MAQHQSYHRPPDAPAKLGDDKRLGVRRRALTLDEVDRDAPDHEDFRATEAVAKVLAEFSTEDRLFKPLLARVERAKREDGLAWSMMRRRRCVNFA